MVVLKLRAFNKLINRLLLMIPFFVGLSGGVFATQQDSMLGLSDVSVLLPLPKSDAEFDLYLSPQSSGLRGLLLPPPVVSKLIPLLPEFDNDLVAAQQLRVVAIRIDPCFAEGETPRGCRRQIRFVWQPLVKSDLHTNAFTTRDAAVHSFYEFTDAEFKVLLQQWQILPRVKQKWNLSVHPELQSQGMNSAYWDQLKTLILNNCGSQNLVRVTAMNVMAGEQLWVFAGFDLEAGKSKPIVISKLNKTSQGVIQSSSVNLSFTGGLLPAPLKVHEEFSKLVADSTTFMGSSTEEEIRKAFKSSVEIENPLKHNPGTVDCASCHLAGMVTQWGSKNWSEFALSRELAEARYSSWVSATKADSPGIRTNQLRAFGYFENRPVITQRILNETLEVTKNLNQQ